MKILILDDDKDTCVLLKMFFEKKNHTLLTANLLIDGLKIIDDEWQDVFRYE